LLSLPVTRRLSEQTSRTIKLGLASSEALAHLRHRENMAMDSPQSCENWADLQVQKMIGSAATHPVATQQVRIAFESAELRLEENVVRNAETSGEQFTLRISLPDEGQCATAIIPVFNDGRLLLVGRYRYPIGRWSIEFPRSICQMRDAGWRQPAEQNLLKDTGLTADQWRLIGAVQVDPALMSTTALVILAEGCARSHEKAFDPVELIAGSVAVTLSELDDLLRRGEVVCGVTLAALCLYRAGLQPK
jgi:hypothetical protein